MLEFRGVMFFFVFSVFFCVFGCCVLVLGFVWVRYQGVYRRIRLGWVSCSLFSPIPTHQKIFAQWEKSGPQNATFNLFFLGWGWPLLVGEFVGFIMIFVCFPNPAELGKS